MNILQKFLSWGFATHLKIGGMIRLFLVIYSAYHDAYFQVPYTDIDYKVFTDAARHVYEGDSPYKRQTYRYSPIIAFILLPNVFQSDYFGKKLFCLFDALVAIALKILVERQLKSKPNAAEVAKYCALFWIYNPLSIAISTRGNADSLTCFFVIMGVVSLQSDVIPNLRKYLVSGAFLGASIHLRLYPLVLCFPMYLSLGEYRINGNTRLVEGLMSFPPNKKQIALTFSCISTLSFLTYSMYDKYGYEFLFETYIYHLFRRDIKHNFSVIFYYTYLTKDDLPCDLLKVTLQICEIFLMFVVSVAFGSKSETLPFALFCLPALLVTYNSVMTSQYFIWFLSMFPLVVHCFKMKISKAVFLFTLWLSVQGGWLFFAYLLEFKNKNVYIFIWFMGLAFFCTNIYILEQLMKSYRPGYGFGLTTEANVKKNE